MGLFEPKWLIKLASCFKIAVSGSLWACRWFCHNCITASFSAFFFFFKQMHHNIHSLEHRLWISRIPHLMDSLERCPALSGCAPLQAGPSHQSFKPQCYIIPSQSVPLCIPLINSTMSRFQMDGFNLWSLFCGDTHVIPSRCGKKKPRGLQVRDKHSQRWQCLPSTFCTRQLKPMCVSVNMIKTVFDFQERQTSPVGVKKVLKRHTDMSLLVCTEHLLLPLKCNELQENKQLCEVPPNPHSIIATLT